MNILFSLIVLLSLICFIAGMVKPKLVIRWGTDEKKNRKNVLKYYGVVFVAFTILSVATAPGTESTDKEVATNNEQPPKIEQTTISNDDAKLNDSRIAFNNAKKFEDSKDYVQAAIEYGMVIKEDENYQIASDKINEMMQKLEESQEVVISNLKLTKDSIDDNQATMVLMNKTTDKVVKVVTLDILAYDKEGFPVKSNFGYDKVFKAEAEKNIQPGESTTELTWVTYADESTTEYRACIVQVEYYDGTTWDNPLYQFWNNEFFNKPLVKDAVANSGDTPKVEQATSSNDVEIQEVVISNLKLTKDSIDDNQATMVLTNKTTDKVVKVVTLDILAYDGEGYPVKTNFGYDKVFIAEAEKNIQPGESTKELTWVTYADETTTEYRACVVQVEYYDGTTWENPLYQSWYNEFYDKPLK